MTEPLQARRARLMGPNVPTFYDTPVHIVRAEGVWLWDAAGRRYLDAYNNVPHVGHGHPVVVEAIARQAARLNTHTRYLHTGILDYIERLTATLDHGLSQMILTCTGSEANDIALRLAFAATGKPGVIATDNTYHGNTAATAQLSARRPPIGGYPPHVRLVPAPEPGMTPEGFAQGVAAAIADLDASGIGFGALMLCPLFANEGLPPVAPGFCGPAEAAVRRAGGLILCDEVQSGFGRLGSHFWGHDWMQLAPDVVTVGKPMANGYPAAGLITRPELMAAFRDAFGYFNTFAGSPVACAAAAAVLDVMEEDALQARAAASGARAMDRLRALHHPRIAGVRGQGAFYGLVFDHEDGRPAPGFARRVTEAMRDRGVLLNRIGRHMNILKMRPPLPFTEDHADIAMTTLAAVLADLEPRDDD